MRRINFIILVFLFILTAITGFAESSPTHEGRAVAHIALFVLLVISLLVHLWLNRKACARYLSNSVKKERVSPEK